MAWSAKYIAVVLDTLVTFTLDRNFVVDVLDCFTKLEHMRKVSQPKVRQP